MSWAAIDGVTDMPFIAALVAGGSGRVALWIGSSAVIESPAALLER